MPRPPLWKIKRELKRLLTQPLQWPADTLSYLFGASYYDFYLARKRITKRGIQPASAQHAVYLIFPEKGLLPSHIRSLRYLVGKGVSTTVVSNFPMSEEDRAQVLALCHTYIERPNFGYDFGGYRDGVLSLESGAGKLDRLILLNDSVWFPVEDSRDWLADVDALGVDFSAAASHYGFPRVDPEAFRSIQFEYSSDRNSFHYCSFAISFSRKVIEHPTFFQFWKRFPLTNKKKRTVRRGEIGLTAWALKHNFSHAETSGINQLKNRLDQYDSAQLKEIAQSMIILGDNAMKQIKADTVTQPCQMSSSEWKKLILTIVARQGASYALAHYNVIEQDYFFLKKSPVRLDPEAAAVTLQILDKLDTPAAREIKQEICGKG
ncbi:MAG: rhamnan synthesis F family protein [Pseudomonadota bacterium]